MHESADRNEILIRKISKPSATRNVRKKVYSIRKDQVFQVPKFNS
jgi:hypothetical protein